MCLKTHPPLFSSCQRQREPERDELLLPMRELLLLDELLLLAEPLPEALLRELLPDTLLRVPLPEELELRELLPDTLLRELLPEELVLRELPPDTLLRELPPDAPLRLTELPPALPLREALLLEVLVLRELLPLLRDTSSRELAEELPRDAPAELSLDALFAAIELRRPASESAFTTRLLEATFT